MSRHLLRVLPFVLLLIPGLAFASGKNLHDQGIHWFGGSVDEAFAAAKQQQKPIFLYWGATWCPPCNQLKATLFKNPGFIRKTQLFIPVYLDGDTQAAQQWGEHFGVLGYPTLILFSPDGEEITRLSGGMSLESYPRLLDLALAKVKPVARLLEEILDQGRKPTPQELHLLAWYAWDQDGGKALGGRELSEVLKALAARVPSSLPREKARLDAQYLMALAERQTPPSVVEKEDAVQRLEAVLANQATWRDNFHFLVHGMETLLPRIADRNGPRWQRLMAAWDKALQDLQQDGQLGPARHLQAWSGRLTWLKMAGKTLAPSLQADIRRRVEAARKQATDGHERIAVAYAAYGLLEASGQRDQAEKLITEEMAAGSNNHYWMLVLADLAEEGGNAEEALNWYARAWETARGAATRIQWGSYYIRQLTEQTPDDDERIMAVSKALFTELGKQKTPFHGRSRKALERVFKALNAWGEVSSPAELIELKHAFIDVCMPFGKEAMVRCEAIMKAS